MRSRVRYSKGYWPTVALKRTAMAERDMALARASDATVHRRDGASCIAAIATPMRESAKEKYAVVTLSRLAFRNLMTVLLACLHLKYQWAQFAFAPMQSKPAELLAARLCLLGVQVYSTLRRRNIHVRRSEGGRHGLGG